MLHIKAISFRYFYMFFYSYLCIIRKKPPSGGSFAVCIVSDYLISKSSSANLSNSAPRAIRSGVGCLFPRCALQIFLPSSSNTARTILRPCFALWYWFTITRGRCISLPSFVVRAVYVWCIHLCRVRLLHPISSAAACRVFRLSRSISRCGAVRFIAYF